MYSELPITEGRVVDTIYDVEDGMRNANAELFKFRYNHHGKDFTYRIVAKEVLKFDPYKIEYGTDITTEFITTKLPFSSSSHLRAVILNDVHGVVETYEELLTKDELARTNIVFINGDAFDYVLNKEDVISKLLKPVSTLFASQIPFVLVRGNHETRGKFARNFKQYFDYPNDKYYHTLALGKALWIVLDGGEDKTDDHPVYAGTVDYDNYRLEQHDWLSKLFERKVKDDFDYIFVVNHIPFFHSDDWHGTLHNRACFNDILKRNKIDLLFAGHTHTYGYYESNGDHNYGLLIGGGPNKGNRTLVSVAYGNTVYGYSGGLKAEDGTSLFGFAKGKTF